MAALKKAAITAPRAPAEAVQVDALGGEVIVRGLMLSDRLRIVVGNGEDGFGQVARILHATVVDADGERIFTVDEWEAFGARHFDDAWNLFGIAQRLSGLDGEAAEKK